MDGTDALLVGSVPLVDTEHVLRTCAGELGEYLAAIPDGETGDRTQWITVQAYRVFDGHPGLVTTARPRPIDGLPQWMPTALDDCWRFGVRDRSAPLRFENLRYADEARRSYSVFVQLRAAGVIPAGTRFQVSLPSTESVMLFFPDPADYEMGG